MSCRQRILHLARLNMATGRLAVILGGKGALGRSFVNRFTKAEGWCTLSVDIAREGSDRPDVVVSGTTVADYKNLVEEVSRRSGGAGVDALVCAAGGFEGVPAGDDGFLQAVENMYNSNLQPALVSAHLGAKLLKPDGLLVFCGAQAVKDGQGTPGFETYGFTKAATHHLVTSLGSTSQPSMPAGAKVVAILPSVLDTPMNRKFMPDADFSTWTKLDDVADLVANWAENTSKAPASGSLVDV